MPKITNPAEILMKGLLDVLNKLVTDKMPANPEIINEIKAIEDKLRPGCEKVTEQELAKYKELVTAISEGRYQPGDRETNPRWK
ncbi:MAG: hypothetical protein AAF810_20045 [Cyanobacteria bacterium P01_D01_bin.36]